MQMNNPITIKLPSPSLSSIKWLASQHLYHVLGEEMIERYVENVVSRLGDVNGVPFLYQNMKIKKDGIYIDIDLDSINDQLMPIKDMDSMYQKADFRSEFRRRVAKVCAKEVYNNNEITPVINSLVYKGEGSNHPKLLIEEPINTWPKRWISIYIWTVIGIDISHDSSANYNDRPMLSDAAICHALLLELENFDIY